MEFYGLLGEKLSHSLSPEIHNQIFEELNIEGAYKLIEVPKEDLSKVSTGIKVIGIKGMNVTIPYKEDIMPYLDFISEEAKSIGAVNTILNQSGKLLGYNTDYFGFGKMLQENGITIVDKSIFILGNGGACKAVYQYLLQNGAREVYIVSRKSLNENKFKTYEELREEKGDILINTTPVGMYPNINNSPVDEEIINNFNTLVDIIYNPMETEFLKIGKRLGKKICGGLGMLVWQAVRAEEIWGNKVSDDIGIKILENLSTRFI